MSVPVDKSETLARMLMQLRLWLIVCVVSQGVLPLQIPVLRDLQDIKWTREPAKLT